MKVLEPLKTVTNIMCAEHTPIVSLIYPMKAVILENMSESVHDSNLVRDVKQAIRNDLIKCYSEEDTADFLLLRAALDPRFKGLPRLEPDKRDEIYSNIESRVILLGKEPVKVSTYLSFHLTRFSIHICVKVKKLKFSFCFMIFEKRGQSVN